MYQCIHINLVYVFVPKSIDVHARMSYLEVLIFCLIIDFQDLSTSFTSQIHTHGNSKSLNGNFMPFFVLFLLFVSLLKQFSVDYFTLAF